MATDAENIATRRSAILTELAGLTSTSNGGRPSYSIDGQSVSHTEYRMSLLAELKQLAELQASIEGSGEYLSEGFC